MLHGAAISMDWCMGTWATCKDWQCADPFRWKSNTTSQGTARLVNERTGWALVIPWSGGELRSTGDHSAGRGCLAWGGHRPPDASIAECCLSSADPCASTWISCMSSSTGTILNECHVFSWASSAMDLQFQEETMCARYNGLCGRASWHDLSPESIAALKKQRQLLHSSSCRWSIQKLSLNLEQK